jgi:molybdopterin molybdotransferase
MIHDFLELLPMEKLVDIRAQFNAIERKQQVESEESVGWVCAETLFAPEDLPPFNRSLMDGYAVRSADVASARETTPAFLDVVGHIGMGERTPLKIGTGQAAAIPTGAMLPMGADAVVMIEHTRKVDGSRIEVSRPTGVGQHVLNRGEDLRAQSELLPQGHRIQALDLGTLLACGVHTLTGFAKPRVAILSTGDELVDCKQPTLPPGRVRDTNAATLAAQVKQAGGEPFFAGRIVDDCAALTEATQQAQQEADMVLLSGGSSVGLRDHTARVLRALSHKKLLITGIAISPGKPTLLADISGKPVFGMPGHPVSSFVVFHVVVVPFLRRISGEQSIRRPHRCSARLTANAPGAPGKETWLRVRLDRSKETTEATPIPGTSAVYTSLLASDGLLCVPSHQEGWARGDHVHVEVLR